MSRFVLPQESTFDINGLPQNGATLDFHNPGLLTDKQTFSDEALTTPNTNPVVADASGNFGNIWMIGDYDVTLKNSLGVTIWGPERVKSNVTSSSSSSANELTTATMANNPSYSSSDVGSTVITTAEFSTGNDGGGVYDVVLTSSVTPNTYNIIIGVSDPLISFELRLGEVLSAAQFNVTGDGVTDDTLAIQFVINLANTLGGRQIFFTRGTYIISASSEPDSWTRFGGGTRLANTAGLLLRANVRIIGESKQSVNIKSLDGGITLVYLVDSNNVEIGNMSFEGAYDGVTGAGAGLFNVASDLSDDIKGIYIHDVFVQTVGGYGIGLNEAHLLDCRIENVETFFTGADGLDAKSRSTDTTEVDTGNSITNMTVRQFGLSTTLAGQVGVDIRGSWNLSGIFVRDFGATGTSPWSGIRLRPVGEVNNLAQFTNVTNVVIDGGGNADTFGIQISGDKCNVSNVTVKNPATGIKFAGNDCNLSNIVCFGHSVEALNTGTDSNNIQINNFTAVAANGATRHFRFEGKGAVFQGYGDNAIQEISIGGNAVDDIIRRSANGTFYDTVEIYEITAGRVGIQARGPSTNIDIALNPKGTGLLRFGTRTAIGAETITGFITIEDSTGAARKIAIVS